MLSRLKEGDAPLSLAIDEWQCQQCSKIVGWTLLNERTVHWVECWYITGVDAFDERLPRWCNDCVAPSPIPFHEEPVEEDDEIEDWTQIEDPCHWCGGFGEDRHTGKPCGDCAGSGKNCHYDDSDEDDWDEEEPLT